MNIYCGTGANAIRIIMRAYVIPDVFRAGSDSSCFHTISTFTLVEDL